MSYSNKGLFVAAALFLGNSLLVNASASEGVSPFIGLKYGHQLGFNEEHDQGGRPDGDVLGFYGGLQFNNQWSWDLGYQTFESYEDYYTGSNVSTELYETALKYDWYFSDRMSLFGRLGVAYWNVDSGSYDNDGFSPLGEVGLSYSFIPNVKMSVSYQYVDGIDPGHNEYNSHAIFMGLAYTFGGSDYSSNTAVTEAESYIEPVTYVESVQPVKDSVVEIVISEMPAQSTVIYFDVNSTEFSTSNVSKEFIDIAKKLVAHPQAKVEIVGHTDSIGSEEYNLELSKQRVLSVAKWLNSNGVAAEQMVLAGFGESKPIADNNTPKGRELNRRVDANLLPFKYKK